MLRSLNPQEELFFDYNVAKTERIYRKQLDDHRKKMERNQEMARLMVDELLSKGHKIEDLVKEKTEFDDDSVEDYNMMPLSPSKADQNTLYYRRAHKRHADFDFEMNEPQSKPERFEPNFANYIRVRDRMRESFNPVAPREQSKLSSNISFDECYERNKLLVGDDDIEIGDLSDILDVNESINDQNNKISRIKGGRKEIGKKFQSFRDKWGNRVKKTSNKNNNNNDQYFVDYPFYSSEHELKPKYFRRY